MPIPKHAKRVFKGIIFDVYQWRQKMFNGEYATFEKVKRQDTVVVMATVGNKIVVLKQKQPDTDWFYSTPAGRMDIPGEKPEEAAKRELLEETGMIADKFIFWKKYESRGKVVSTVYYYIARNCKKIGSQKLDAGEKIKVQLTTFDNFLKLSENPASNMDLSLPDMFKARLSKKYKSQLKKTIFG